MAAARSGTVGSRSLRYVGRMSIRTRCSLGRAAREDGRAEPRPRGLRGILAPAVVILVPMMLNPAFGEERSASAGDTGAVRQDAPAPLPGPLFPALEGHDIDGRKLVVPAQLDGSYNLVVVAYERYHQRLVDTWIERARELERRNDHIRVYEIPVIRNMSWIRRKQLDFWMSQGISDPLARATTITIYTDVDRINRSLRVPHSNNIRLFLIDQSGAVYWRGAGPYDRGQFRALEQTVEALRPARNI